jgi:TRAP-type C4-dicarboxylate transport system substrate-binding protein
MKQKITWLLFHEPAELFIRTAEHFEKKINELTGDKYKFEILMLSDYERYYNNGDICDPIEEMRAGRVQMSQLYSQCFPAYTASDFNVLGLPFLFRDHDHATRVFEGKVGTQLLDHLQDRVQVRGLGFTYSGGYRCWKSDRPINSLEDLKGLKVRHKRHPVGSAVWDLLGVEEAKLGETANIANSTLPRFHADGQPHQHYATESGHSMYLTTIFMNLDLWNSLDEQTQKHFETASHICSRTERVQSVADADEIKRNNDLALSRGIHQISRLSDTEQQRLVNLLKGVKTEWAPYFTPGLVDDILAA